ncbi:hypothetical protein L210DRAFT_943921 [Boletus edulis BED1]|uniref:Uncharacterized protein n=1 Tax=Boletus edulis BED1 TaxID=1328754 RepID=A0AAD4C2W3_BOLED|nr:hypothetical protein L210DRAFT_943921 [Boletus edulis BED1]
MEFISAMNKRFVVHDSRGFESYETVDMVRSSSPEDGHARTQKPAPRSLVRISTVPISRLCLQIPYTGGRLLEAGMERFLQRRDEIPL